MSGTTESGARTGRPRSERARQAVLEAVDDLLVEQGYAAMTMKGIAERAGVGRQTVYRWWTTKAEILIEACATDAADELQTGRHAAPADDLYAYLTALTRYLTRNPAGYAYLALLGEAQHDRAVRELITSTDVLHTSACAVLARVRPVAPGMPTDRLAVAQLIGPPLEQILTGSSPLGARLLRTHVTQLLRAWSG